MYNLLVYAHTYVYMHQLNNIIIVQYMNKIITSTVHIHLKFM